MQLPEEIALDPSLILYAPLWKLDGNAISSADAYGRTGTVTGALWSPKGRSFNGGTDRIVFSDTSSLRPAHITIECLLKLDRTGAGAAGEENIITKQGAVQAFYFYIPNNTSVMYWNVWTTALNANILQNPDGSNWTVPVNQWFDIIVTYDGTIKTAFINNQQALDAVVTTPGDITYDATNLGVGNFASGGAGTQGIIALVRIWNRALNKQECFDLYELTRKECPWI